MSIIIKKKSFKIKSNLKILFFILINKLYVYLVISVEKCNEKLIKVLDNT